MKIIFSELKVLLACLAYYKKYYPLLPSPFYSGGYTAIPCARLCNTVCEYVQGVK